MGQNLPTRRRLLNGAMRRLADVQSIETLIAVLRESAREIAGAQGIAVVRRDGDHVVYVAEDAIAPLWTGQRFPIESCISGLAILDGHPILIPDIYLDPRVPLAAYEPTFVRRLAAYPIGLMDRSMALGVYWDTPGPIDPALSPLLASLARFAGVTLGRVTDGRGADPG